MLNRRCIHFLLLAFCLLISFSVSAETKIAVLDFELNDLTIHNENREDVERAATLKPLLEKALALKGRYTFVPIASEAQASANKGFGYLFEHPDFASELAAQAGADIVVVGRVHKASYLFVYFKAQVIDVKTQRLLGDLVIEVKGSQRKLIDKGIAALAEQIDEVVQRKQF